MTNRTKYKILLYCKQLEAITCESEGQIMVQADDDFPVYGMAHTRKAAEEELASDLETLWLEFVEIEPSKLTRGAVALRNRLIEKFGDGMPPDGAEDAKDGKRDV